MACAPTPTAILYSTSTSWIESTFTISSAVVDTPSSTTVFTTSSCLSTSPPGRGQVALASNLSSFTIDSSSSITPTGQTRRDATVSNNSPTSTPAASSRSASENSRDGARSNRSSPFSTSSPTQSSFSKALRAAALLVEPSSTLCLSFNSPTSSDDTLTNGNTGQQKDEKKNLQTTKSSLTTALAASVSDSNSLSRGANTIETVKALSKSLTSFWTSRNSYSLSAGSDPFQEYDSNQSTYSSASSSTSTSLSFSSYTSTSSDSGRNAEFIAATPSSSFNRLGSIPNSSQIISSVSTSPSKSNSTATPPLFPRAFPNSPVRGFGIAHYHRRPHSIASIARRGPRQTSPNIVTSGNSASGAGSNSECISWTTITSTSTIKGDPTTLFSTWVVTTSTPSVVTEAYSTLYEPCDSSSSDMSSASTPDQMTTPTSSPTITSQTTPLDLTQVLQSSQTTTSFLTLSTQWKQSTSPTQTAGSTSNPANTQLDVITSSQSSPSSPFSITSSFFSSSSLPNSFLITLSLTTGFSTSPNADLVSSANQGVTVTAGTSTSSGIAGQSTSGSKTNTGVATGAAIGGILAMIAGIALILLAVRWWTQRKRGNRIRQLRSSWFYGGDVDIPGDEKEHEQNGEPVSRFSAPSLASARFSVFPTFITQPLANLRHSVSAHGSARRNSQWADKYHFNNGGSHYYTNHQLQEMNSRGQGQEEIPPLPPMPLVARSAYANYGATSEGGGSGLTFAEALAGRNINEPRPILRAPSSTSVDGALQTSRATMAATASVYSQGSAISENDPFAVIYAHKSIPMPVPFDDSQSNSQVAHSQSTYQATNNERMMIDLPDPNSLPPPPKITISGAPSPSLRTGTDAASSVFEYDNYYRGEDGSSVRTRSLTHSRVYSQVTGGVEGGAATLGNNVDDQVPSALLERVKASKTVRWEEPATPSLEGGESMNNEADQGGSGEWAEGGNEIRIASHDAEGRAI